MCSSDLCVVRHLALQDLDDAFHRGLRISFCAYQVINAGKGLVVRIDRHGSVFQFTKEQQQPTKNRYEFQSRRQRVQSTERDSPYVGCGKT